MATRSATCVGSGPDEQGEEQLEHPGLSREIHLQPDYGEDSYRGSGKLPDKRALITGGDSGIGRAVALAFAREGADVLISHLDGEEGDAQETCRLVEEAGRKAVRCRVISRTSGSVWSWWRGRSLISGVWTFSSTTRPTRCRRMASPTSAPSSSTG
jgi:hypothetical protein